MSAAGNRGGRVMIEDIWALANEGLIYKSVNFCDDERGFVKCS